MVNAGIGILSGVTVGEGREDVGGWGVGGINWGGRGVNSGVAMGAGCGVWVSGISVASGVMVGGVKGLVSVGGEKTGNWGWGILVLRGGIGVSGGDGRGSSIIIVRGGGLEISGDDRDFSAIPWREMVSIV
ncbi:hypothetical protein [Calothrix sp. NIES-3974]|uniref:hypothetical protein n=1 Tax=Calothrix sp. NIES-3974 TaxID=2005462 RepID=UPI000B5E2795|nr:hypothetical protein [Calothrix sp. NIES-3974]BAZ05505.1 hypothetical protein NIES3974_21530 [Calothrix sp. NIES-3974]